MVIKLINEIYKYRDEAKAKILLRFFKCNKGEYGYGDVFLGINVPTIRRIAKEYINIELAEVLTLLKRKEHEIRMCALLILVYKFKKRGSNKKEIFDLYINNTKYISNWDLVDVTCPNIVGEYLFDKDRFVLYSLANSNSIWERRIAIISTLRFIKNNEFKDTLEISKLLLHDEHDLIHKAVGWMLREVYKRDKQIIISFLNEYGSIMPRVMLRYAIEKMDNKLRLYYLHKGKKKSKL